MTRASSRGGAAVSGRSGPTDRGAGAPAPPRVQGEPTGTRGQSAARPCPPSRRTLRTRRSSARASSASRSSPWGAPRQSGGTPSSAEALLDYLKAARRDDVSAVTRFLEQHARSPVAGLAARQPGYRVPSDGLLLAGCRGLAGGVDARQGGGGAALTRPGRPGAGRAGRASGPPGALRRPGGAVAREIEEAGEFLRRVCVTVQHVGLHLLPRPEERPRGACRRGGPQ